MTKAKLFEHFKNFVTQKLPLMFLSVMMVIHLVIAVRTNIFRYNNFDFGKFDLGNMTQMVWNTLQGRPLYLTDYFGTNLPRWSMSHVDPILLLFVPIFAVFPHALTLVFSQLVLVISGAVVIYFLADLKLKSKWAACFLGTAYLFYPSLGYLNALTGFHGVTAVIPFFLGAVYVSENMLDSAKFSKKSIFTFWILAVLTMSGKEQLPLYIFMYGLYVLVTRVFLADVPLEKPKKLILLRHAGSMMIVGLIWFITAFFVIIPAFAQQRIDGYRKFAISLGLENDTTRDVSLPNYFLSRYDAFGDSYVEIIFGMLTDPRKGIQIFFGGDKLDNLHMTFAPVLYLPLVAPLELAISGQDFAINYMTSAGGIGTSEIYNHRISMIIPVLFISVIFAIKFLSKLPINRIKKFKLNLIQPKHIALVLSLAILVSNIKYTYEFGNPIYLWLTQAVQKRIKLATVVIASALERTDSAAQTKNLKIGEVLKVSELDNKDLACANKVVKMIPDEASVSGPDYLGAHLAKRETYAIFPALYNEADYVIVDVFSRKILSILDVQTDLISDVIEKIISDPNYELQSGCGNLFIFKKIGPHQKSELMPIQERYSYPDASYKLPIYAGLQVVDFTLPSEFERGTRTEMQVVYQKVQPSDLGDYVMFMTFVNVDSGEVYQTANLPSFGILQPREWGQDRFYVETLQIAPPSFVPAGTYRTFVGMTNKIKTRSIYLGNTEFK